MFNSYPDVLTVPQMATALGIGLNKAYEMLRDGFIGHKRIGKRYIIPKQCVVDYLQSSRYTIHK